MEAIRDVSLWRSNMQSMLSVVQTCLQCRYAQGQTLVTVHMRIGTQRTIHCTDYLFIGPEYSKVARGMLYMFTVTDPFSGKHWPVNCVLESAVHPERPEAVKSQPILYKGCANSS